MDEKTKKLGIMPKLNRIYNVNIFEITAQQVFGKKIIVVISKLKLLLTILLERL